MAQVEGSLVKVFLGYGRVQIQFFKMPKRWAKTGWQHWQLDLLGTAPAAELAERFGRTRSAVRAMRWRLDRRQA